MDPRQWCSFHWHIDLFWQLGCFNSVSLLIAPGTTTFRGTAGRMNSLGQMHSFRNPLRLNRVCHLRWSNWSLLANLFWANEESCSTSRLTWPLIDSKCSNQLLRLGRNIISTMVAMLTDNFLWPDTRKEWGSQLTTSAGDADPLRKRRLLSTFFVSVRFLLGVDMGYLARHFFSAWWSYHLLISRI